MTVNHALIALLGLGVGIACAPAYADSSDTARVADIQYGNGLDPSGFAALSDQADPVGMSWLHAGSLRSPSGIPYGFPALPPPEHERGEWRYSGLLSAGVINLSGDDDAQLFRQYTDWSNGLALGSLWFDAYRPDSGHYADLRASHLSENDQFFAVGEFNFIDLRLHVGPLVITQRFNLNFAVEVADIADDGPVFHVTHVIQRDHVDIAGRRDEDVAD